MDNIAWLAGLLEGEGAFCVCKGTIQIQLNMTDEDVVRRAAKIIGAPSVGLNNRNQIRNSKHKPCYRWTLCGQKAAIWMKKLLPYMGARRSARIKELLPLQAKKRPYRVAITACPHTNRKHQGRGMCNRCYQADWYRRKKAGEVERGHSVVNSTV